MYAFYTKDNGTFYSYCHIPMNLTRLVISTPTNVAAITQISGCNVCYTNNRARLPAN